MNRLWQQEAALILIICALGGGFANAQDLNAVGLNLLRAVTTNVNGTGVRVAQVEVGSGSPPSFEVYPTNSAVGGAACPFTYFSSLGSATNYPNSVGSESLHAEQVAASFYGLTIGLATNVAHMDNYNEAYFLQFNGVTATLPPTNIDDAVVNQSFVYTSLTSAQQQILDSAYDNYGAQYSALFVTGVGDGGTPDAPATSYNGLGVAAYRADATSSVGPTVDNGRCKPDITAPAGATSFSTPQVAGAAADLIQAGLRGDGGSDTNSAADLRTVKALLLNGAVKPTGWTNGTLTPLDARYGAGVVNILNSYEQLAGGKHGYCFATNVPFNTAHPPVVLTNTIAALSGWDFNTNTTTTTADGVNHYFFNISNSVAAAKFTATATLVWNRHQSQTKINNLNLYFYNAANSNLVACSTSRVDNVEHIFVPSLAQGRYDLQVWKTNGISISASESYALAWEFFTERAQAFRSGTNAVVAWPVYPAGFLVQTATNLISPSWTALSNLTATVSNNQNQLIFAATNKNQFFRLRRPNL